MSFVASKKSLNLLDHQGFEKFFCFNLEGILSKTCMHAKSPQSCSTLCDSMDYNPPGSSVHGISQARIPEWAVCSVAQLYLTFVTPPTRDSLGP